MKVISYYISFILLLIIILSGCIHEDTEPSEDYVVVGNTIPSFVINDGKGNVFRSSQFTGKMSLLVLFNTECSDCKRVLPRVQTIWEAVMDYEDVVLLTISRDQTNEETEKYWNDNNFTMIRYEDPDRKVYSLFASSVIPRLYVINEEGRVIKVYIEDLLEDEIPEVIDLLIGK